MLKNIHEYKYGNDSLNVEEHFNKVLVNEIQKQIDETFNNVLIKDLKIDLDQNKSIVSEVNDIQSKLDRTNKKLKHSNGICTLLKVLAIFSIISGVILLTLSILGLTVDFEIFSTYWYAFMFPGIALIALSIFLFVFSKSYKKKTIVPLQQIATEQTKQLEEAKDKGYKQLQGIPPRFNQLLVYRMCETIYPMFQFDDALYTSAHQKEWSDVLKMCIDNNMSIYQCVSGLAFTHPFLLLKHKQCEKYTATYMMSQSFPYTTTRRDSQGHTTTVTMYETLTAYQYRDAYRYNYGSTALLLTGDEATTLKFNNESPLKHQHDVNRFYKKHMKDGMYPNVNVDFDINFPCIRNNDAQFRLLFTPLAQKEIVNLVKAQDHAYDVSKDDTINIVKSHFGDELSAAFNAELLKQYDFDVLKQTFHNFVLNFFKNVYYSLAPLLCIPLYQQFSYNKYINKADTGVCDIEVEALINHIPPEIVNHPESDTDNLIRVSGGKSTIKTILSETFKLVQLIVPTVVHGIHVGTKIINVPVTEFHPRSRTTRVSQKPIDKSLLKVADYMDISKTQTTIKYKVAEFSINNK